MIELSGIAFRHVNKRLRSLKLVELGLTGAAMFAADGEVLQPSEFSARNRYSPSEEITTCENLQIKPELQKLYGYVLDRGGINHVDNYSPDCLRVFSRDMLKKIKDCDISWEEMVPPSVASVIKDRKYFNFQYTGA